MSWEKTSPNLMTSLPEYDLIAQGQHRAHLGKTIDVCFDRYYRRYYILYIKIPPVFALKCEELPCRVLLTFHTSTLDFICTGRMIEFGNTCTLDIQMFPCFYG